MARRRRASPDQLDVNSLTILDRKPVPDPSPHFPERQHKPSPRAPARNPVINASRSPATLARGNRQKEGWGGGGKPAAHAALRLAIEVHALFGAFDTEREREREQNGNGNWPRRCGVDALLMARIMRLTIRILRRGFSSTEMGGGSLYMDGISC